MWVSNTPFPQAGMESTQFTHVVLGSMSLGTKWELAAIVFHGTSPIFPY